MALDKQVPDQTHDGRSTRDLGDARSVLRERLALAPAGIAAVNALLARPDNPLVEGLLDLVDRYGGVAEINRKAAEAECLETRLSRLRDERSPYLDGLEWLREQRDTGAFASLAEYRQRVLGKRADDAGTDEEHAVTLEIKSSDTKCLALSICSLVAGQPKID